MDEETIKQAIEAGPEGVKRLVESEADRRVNQAKAKWDAEFQGHVENAVNERLEANRQHQEKAERLAARFKEKLAERDVKETFAEPFTPDFGALVDEEDEGESKLDEIVERVANYQVKVRNDMWPGSKPKISNPSASDPSELRFRQAMGLNE